MDSSMQRLITIAMILVMASSGFIIFSESVQAESWSDDFTGPGLDSRWVMGGVGSTMIRSGGGTVFAYSYTGDYDLDWHGPYLRAQLPAFLDFDITANIRCISQELQINRLMIRVLDESGNQIYSFGWSDFLASDSKAEIGLYGPSDSISLYKTASSYNYSNFYDQDIRLVRSGQSLSFFIKGIQVHIGTATGDVASHVEIYFIKFKEECTNDVLDLNRISVSTTEVHVPGPPGDLSGRTGNRYVALTWSQPLDTGGLPVTGYKLYRGTVSGNETFLTSLSSATGFNDTGLVNGQTYFYRVSAVNALGEGTKSETLSATPTTLVTVPGVPSFILAIASSGSVRLSWGVPNDDGGSPLIGYKLYRSTDETPHLLVSLGLSTSYEDSAVSDGIAYHYWVAATNSAGTGPLTYEATAVPGSGTSLPSEPRALSAVAGDGSVILNWIAPISSGNLPILGYRIYRDSGTSNPTLIETVSAVNDYADSGLSNGVEYTYRVHAFNFLGDGPASEDAKATPADNSAPSELQNFVLVPGNHSVALTWSAPQSDGGSPLIGYRIYRGNYSGSESLLVVLGNVLTYVDTGLVNNKMYYYKVSAYNSLGEGPALNGSAKPQLAAVEDNEEEEEEEEEETITPPSWTDNFTLTSSIATVISLVVGGAIVFLYMRGGASTKDPNKPVDDKAEDDGADEEE